RSGRMACDRLNSLWRDEGGAVILEFTVTMLVFMTVLFGTIEFGYAFYQWNVATKAVQLGARLAAVSNPVASNLLTLTGLEDGTLPGAAMPNFNCVCSGATAACTGSVPSGATACTYNAAAMNALV